MNSKTRVDRLGETLKRGSFSDAALRELDQYRRSFADGYETVLGSIRESLGLAATGRPAKSTKSIVEKLQRESIRLSQMQDIAGCRLVVPGIAEQERAVTRLRGLFESVAVIDRRTKSSHGYRAVHLIVKLKGLPIEIQIRTALQHAWAEYSEKLADVVDPAVKYGGGHAGARDLLLRSSVLCQQVEDEKLWLAATMERFTEVGLSPDLRERMASTQAKLDAREEELRSMLEEFRKSFDKRERR